ncbi:MAG TPA: hypothetical protein VLH15_09225 [Dehalococcoidales bacterium]|nr:hypothetical protein [Dehalococcoidales bacterium]
MNTHDTWNLIEGKMLELRILTNGNWKNQEYELAALGERVLRTVEASKSESERLRADMENLSQSVDELRNEWRFRGIFEKNE